MRSIEEVRDQKLGEFRAMIERPEMWALDGRSMQTLALGVLHDLCFMDERDDELSEQRNSLVLYQARGRRRFRSRVRNRLRVRGRGWIGVRSHQ